jgi:hypothetical protein
MKKIDEEELEELARHLRYIFNGKKSVTPLWKDMTFQDQTPWLKVAMYVLQNYEKDRSQIRSVAAYPQ